MEFDEALSLLQGTIYSLGNRGLLNSEENLQNAVEALREAMKDYSETAKSKATFFMVLNSRLPISEELKDDEFVGLFTNITPIIEIRYLVDYLYHLKLQEHLFKVIENCPGTLTREVINEILKKLETHGFHRDEFGWDHLYQLWQSIFVKICKIYNRLHASDNLQEFKSYFSCLCDSIKRVLVTLMKMKGRESIAGINLYNFFKSFLFCLKLHKKPALCDEPLFRLNIKSERRETNRRIIPIKDCIEMIFKLVVKILENLTIDLWMNFSECYWEFDSRNSVQFLIGNVIHSIVEELKGCDAPPDVLNCLSSLAVEKFSSVSLDEIIFKVRKGEKEWFEALVKHPSVTENKSVKCLRENLNLASPKDLNTLLNVSFEFICSAEGNANLDLMKDLFLAAVKVSPDCSKWARRVLGLKPGLLFTAHTQDDLTETFNKISKEKSIPKEELVCLCIQAPLKTFKKTCQLAISGSFGIEEVIEVLKELHDLCGRLAGDGCTCLDWVLFKCVLQEELTDREKQLVLHLIMHARNENLLGANFARNLLSTLKAQVERVELEKAVFCLEIMKLSVKFEFFSLDKVVVLVYLSQILGHFSWDVENFSTIKADGRDLIISIVAGIIKELKVTETEWKYSWARGEIVKSWEVNQACFCDLWFRFGCQWPCSERLSSCLLALAHTRHKTQDLVQVLLEIGEPLDVKTSIVLSLAVVLPVVAFSEWSSLSGVLRAAWEKGRLEKEDAHCEVLDMFVSGVYLMTVCLRGREMYPCYEYCLRNFGKLAGRYFPQMSGESLMQTLEKIAFVLSAIRDGEERKTCWMICLPVLLQLIDWMKKKDALEAHKSGILNMLKALDSTEVVETLEKRLS